jgi:hypothetical protein
VGIEGVARRIGAESERPSHRDLVLEALVWPQAVRRSLSRDDTFNHHVTEVTEPNYELINKTSMGYHEEIIPKDDDAGVPVTGGLGPNVPGPPPREVSSSTVERFRR